MKPKFNLRSELAAVLLQFRRAFMAAGVFSMLINILGLVPTIYMLQVYDRVLQSRSGTTLLMLTLVIVLLYIVQALLELARSRLLVRIGTGIDLRMNDRVFVASFEQNLKHQMGSAGAALADLTHVRQFLTGAGLFAFFDAPWAPIYLVVIFLLHPWLGVFAVITAIVLCSLAWLTEKITRAPLTEANKEANSSTAYATNTLRNAEVIEAMGMLNNLKSRWREKQMHFLDLQAQASDRSASITSLTKSIRIAVQSLVLGLGAWLVIEGKMTPGGMIAGSILLGKTLAPIELAIGAWKQFLSARTAYTRLEKLLEENPERKETMSLPRPAGHLQVEHVVAKVPGGQQVILNQVSFQAQPGDVVGVIGPSASGKSSLARLLVGVWPSIAGKVRLDGADVYQWSKQELGPAVGYLPQDIELFAGTVAENICRFGPLDAEKIVTAAKMAGVHEMILKFPKGYETEIGEGGSHLSGGQRQRLGLARALYGTPAFVVLDEPNSNLDDSGEAALVQAVMQLKALGSTVVLISHRSSILAIVNKLLLLVNGSVQAFGPRDKVMQALQGGAQQQQAQQSAQLLQKAAQNKAPGGSAGSAPGQLQSPQVNKPQGPQTPQADNKAEGEKKDDSQDTTKDGAKDGKTDGA